MLKLIKLVVFLLCSTIFSFSTHANPLSEQKLKKLTVLKTMPVINTISMRDFLVSIGKKVNFYNEVYLVTLQDGTKAVYKPVSPVDLGDAYAEVAAFNASQWLGFPEVPPTVIRRINGKIGSLQLYIEPTVDVLQSGVYKKILEEALPEDVANLKLFYFVFGQWDTGAHNLIVQKEQNRVKLYAIDNSGIKNRQYVKYGELPFVRICYSDKLKTNDWHLPFSFEKKKVINNRAIENLRQIFGNNVPEAVLKNLSKNNDLIHYIIYKNSLWVKYHVSDPSFVISHTDFYPERSMVMLKKLNESVLKELFSDAKGSDFLTKDYLSAILERRDQVILAYEKR